MSAPSRASERPRVVGVMKVRDEGDILEDNLRYHHALGVDHFLVTDNASADRTVDVLARYADAGLATVFREESNDFSREAAGWVQRMARLAATDLEADWVLHIDADEFWWPASGTIAETLAGVAAPYSVVIAPRSEFTGPREATGHFAERMTYRESRSSLRPKIAHRADPTVVIGRGAHHVFSTDDEALPKGGSERAVLRGTEPGGEGQADVRFVWAPQWPLRILHFPVRSVEQVRRRTEIFLFEGGFEERGRRKRLREAYDGGGIEAIYSRLAPSGEELEAELASGRLVRDQRLGVLLPRCPDPVATGATAGPVRVEPGPGELERELAELELDAMRLISRFQYRLTTRQEALQRRVEELERKQRTMRRSLRQVQ